MITPLKIDISTGDVITPRAIEFNYDLLLEDRSISLKMYNPDIVYAHSSKAGAIARAADIGLKNRCVYNPHGWAFNMRCSAKKKAMYTAIEKLPVSIVGNLIFIGIYFKPPATYQTGNAPEGGSPQ